MQHSQQDWGVLSKVGITKAILKPRTSGLEPLLASWSLKTVLKKTNFYFSPDKNRVRINESVKHGYFLKLPNYKVVLYKICHY